MITGPHGSVARTKWANSWKVLSPLPGPWKVFRECELLAIIITAQRGPAPCPGSPSQREAEKTLTAGSSSWSKLFLSTEPLSWEPGRWHRPGAYHGPAASPGLPSTGQAQSPNQQLCFSHTHAQNRQVAQSESFQTLAPSAIQR